MFDDLSDLYQQVILDHCKKPRNFHELTGATSSAQGHNPLCGDQLKLYLAMDGEVAVELVWDPPWNQGMMTEAAKLQLGLM